jgi:hypothetical protein
MQTFKILKLSSGGISYTLDERDGFYKATGMPNKGLMDFITDDRVVILKIRRNNLSANIPSLEIGVGDAVRPSNANVTRNTIASFKVVSGILIVYLGNGASWDIKSITTQAPEPAQPVRTATTANVGAPGAPGTRIIPTNISGFADMRTTIINSFNGRTIRLERVLKRRTETPIQFLKKFFLEWNNTDNIRDRRNTIYTDGGTVQTEHGRRRSLGDLYMIMSYYYPNIQLVEVIRLLYVELPTQITRGFRTSRCSQIGKRVWYYNANEPNEVLNSSSNDEFGKTVAWYRDNI